MVSYSVSILAARCVQTTLQSVLCLPLSYCLHFLQWQREFEVQTDTLRFAGHFDRRGSFACPFPLVDFLENRRKKVRCNTMHRVLLEYICIAYCWWIVRYVGIPAALPTCHWNNAAYLRGCCCCWLLFFFFFARTRALSPF